MELRQLKYFVKAAETLNFSEAAKELCVTQSTLSQQIKQLEAELDTQLLQRDSHSVSLTEAGHQLLPHATRTIRDAEMCRERIRELKEVLSGELNIGVTYSFSPILTETIFSFIKSYPHVKLNIHYKPMAELMSMLRERTVDFALAFKPSVKMDDIESHTLFQSYLAAIVGTGHTLAQESKITLDKLCHYSLALPAKGLQARNAFDAMLHRYAIAPRVSIELNDANMLLKLVRQNNMITILSEATIHNEPGVRAIPLDVTDNEMTGCIHLLRDSYHKRSMQEFLKMLSDSVAVRERMTAWI